MNEVRNLAEVAVISPFQGLVRSKNWGIDVYTFLELLYQNAQIRVISESLLYQLSPRFHIIEVQGIKCQFPYMCNIGITYIPVEVEMNGGKVFVVH